jgi:hypothetical protein
MIRVCLKKDGTLIEMQSDDRPKDKALDAQRLATLKDNALSAGYKETDIDVKEVRPDEWQKILDAQPKNEPAPDRLSVLESQVCQLSDALISKNVLTAIDVQSKPITLSEVKKS